MVRVAILFLLANSAVWGSGYYASQSLRPAGSAASSTTYELGKAIFHGKTPLKPAVQAQRVAQSAVLEELQKKLPPSVRKEKNLGELSGRIDQTQLSALKHFLALRYKIQ